MSRIVSFFRYAGGKGKLSSQIVEQVIKQIGGNNVEYREPFFGGGSIGLKILSEKIIDINNIWINDKDVGIACLWTSVIRYPQHFKGCIMSFSPSTDAFYQFKDELLIISSMPECQEQIVDIGFKKLAIHQMSYSGLGTKSGGPLGGLEQKSKYKIDCRWSPSYICKKIDKLHDMFSEMNIRDNMCTCFDFSSLINDISMDAFIYLDPPYYDKGNMLYQYGFSQEDHKRLSTLLAHTQHKWVLSYDYTKAVTDLYFWAEVIKMHVKYSITATKNINNSRRIPTVKDEVIICPK